MNRISIIITLFLFLGFNAAFAQSETKDEKKKNKQTEMTNEKNVNEIGDENAAAKPWNEVCPVGGEEIDYETDFVEYNGKLYGFCCPGCDKKFAKNPDKYSKNLSEDGKKFIGKK